MSDTTFDLIAHLRRQRAFSERTFGPGSRAAGVVAHIRKELAEIERDPTDVTEWIDVVLLALDGAWRAGHSPESIAAALAAKQAKNELRTWPDWRTMQEGAPIEHDRSGDRRTCNRHTDCDAADVKAGGHANHCHDDCCEDCFGQ